VTVVADDPVDLDGCAGFGGGDGRWSRGTTAAGGQLGRAGNSLERTADAGLHAS